MSADIQPTGQPFSPLVGQILTAQAEFTRQVTDSLVDSLTKDRDRAEATIAAIRAGVEALFDGPWVPTPEAILAALYPSVEVVAQYRKDGAA